jgi:hypothetical protein
VSIRDHNPKERINVKKPTRIVVAAFMSVGLTLAGCDAGESVATMSRTEEGAASGGVDREHSEQRDGADALVSCLKDKGIESEIVMLTVEGHSGEWSGVRPLVGDGAFYIPGVGGTSSEGARNALEALGVDPNTEEPMLYYGGQLITDVLTACITTSGYYVPFASFDPREEEVTKQAMAAESNRWADCARQAGLDRVSDAVVVVDNYETMPRAIIPAATSADLLQAVLKECPPLNPDNDLSEGNFTVEDTPQAPDPAIGFDAPENDPRVIELRRILSQKIDDLYKEAHTNQ